MIKKQGGILMLLLIVKVYAFEQKVYCVKSNVSDVSEASCNCQNYTNWSTLTSNSTKYFNSFTKICFPKGSFNLTTRLLIRNVTNISLVGSVADKLTSIKCFNNAFFSISNAAFVEIKGIKLETCGANTERYIKVHEAYTALLLHNVISVTIFNVTFKNSYGHSILGINLMNSSVLQQVSIFYMKDNSTKKKKMGGIVLMFTDVITNYSTHSSQQNILIERCQVYYMNNIQAASYDKRYPIKSLRSLAIGIDFQQKYSVKVTIINIIISTIKAQKGGLIHILYNSTNTNNVTFLNSNFSNNHIYGYPVIEINTDKGGCRSKHCKSINIFQSVSCVLFNNTGKSIYFINQMYNFLHQVVMHIRIVLTVFTYNAPTDTYWKVKFKSNQRFTPMINISIKQCVFASNINLRLEFCDSGIVTLSENNSFINNTLSLKEPKALIKCSKTILIFEGYNEFSFNTAYWILDLTNHTALVGHAIINITQNIGIIEVSEDFPPVALIHFNTNGNNHFCMFQFYSSWPKSSPSALPCNNPADYFNIFFKNNTNYSSIIFGTQLNSCFWLNDTINFGSLTTGDVLRGVIHSNETNKQVVRRQVGTLCYCDNVTGEDCIEDHFGTIFPGQRIPISLKQFPPYSETSIYTIVKPLKQFHDIQKCPVESYQLNWLQSIDNSCTPIYYTVYSNYTARCYISYKTTYPDDSLYIYYIDMHETCPCGFTIVNGSCECDPRLKEAFPTITCDVNTQTITRPGDCWIGLSTQCEILYTKDCALSVCHYEPTSVHLNSSDTQCNHNRGGIACGRCPSGLSAVLGSLRCKRCSNQWLLLIPVFLLAGLFLILILFTLNLTIVEGKINGFILYVNVIAANLYAIFLPSSNIAKVVSLLNIEAAIETCLYDGMTEYIKTWLEFAFPSYLLFIVAMLALASRYSSLVERLTRRRVIPVIATIFLFTYNKLLLVTTKVLFSYTSVHRLSDNKKTTVWTCDTSIPLFGVKFSILFAASLLLMIVILVPINFFLLFTRLSLQIRFLAKYLKPYLDVFQAPFKDSCRHFPGLELLIRWMSFAIGSRFLKSAYERLALDNSLCVFLLVYVCTFKPFRSLTNTVLYISYVINVECVITLMTYSDEHIGETYYIVIIHVLIFIALVEFGVTILYYLYINHLQKIRWIRNFIMNIGDGFLNYYNRNSTFTPNMEPAGEYEHLQEELLLADPVE